MDCCGLWRNKGSYQQLTTYCYITPRGNLPKRITRFREDEQMAMELEGKDRACEPYRKIVRTFPGCPGHRRGNVLATAHRLDNVLYIGRLVPTMRRVIIPASQSCSAPPGLIGPAPDDRAFHSYRVPGGYEFSRQACDRPRPQPTEPLFPRSVRLRGTGWPRHRRRRACRG